MMRFLLRTISLLMLSVAAGAPSLFAADTADWTPPVPLETLRQAKSPLIPFPREVKWGQADWKPNAQTAVLYPRAQAATLASALRSLSAHFTAQGLKLTFKAVEDAARPAANVVWLTVDTALPKEGYTLATAEDGISLKAADAAGAFYGVQTLRQMLRGTGGALAVQHAVIRDWPAFSIRGFMHDTGRNFQSVESLKAQLDRFAAYKLNVFQWHLCDNPGYRIESRAFPQLNDPKNYTRDNGQFYTFAQIRDVMTYARERHITVIPELDMPGHSAYFQRTFGFSMNSPQGMDVLEKLIAEFCKEVPVELSPYFHLGGDEVNIPNAGEFMGRMLKVVRAQKRQPMVWNPGLKADPQTILQHWNDEGGTQIKNPDNNPFVDSGGTYLNLYDPLLIVERLFFRQPAQQPQGDDKALGAILCCWPDTRVEDKINIFRYNAVWPGALAFSEAVWQGRPSSGAAFFPTPPPAGSVAAQTYSEFENRLAAHRDRYFADVPFPFVKNSWMQWRVIGPFPRGEEQGGEFDFEPEKTIQDSYTVDGQTFQWKTVTGGTVMLSDTDGEGLFKKRAPSTAYALTYLYSDTARPIRAWVGFETPARSNRQSGGIPPAGKWDPFGAQVWINDAPLPAPQWKQPGKYQYFSPTWFSPANEIPFTDEEFYWTRDPARVELKKGWNKVLLRVPFGYKGQRWSYTFVPVKEQNKRWVEDESVRSATEPK